MSRFIASLNAFVVLICALLGFYSAPTNGGFTNKDWMSAIDDETKINAISIPGTHDSCALYEPIDSVAKCQDYTVADQLDMGVRFLDLRCFVIGKKIMMCHDVILQGKYLNEILDDCISFLKENPTETVIVSIRDEKKPSSVNFSSMVEGIIEKNKDMWYTQNALPKLGEVRGKLVLFNRFTKENEIGLQAASWRDNDEFKIYNWTYYISVQDNYDIGTDIEKKWEAVKRQFYRAQYNNNYDSDTLFINFISGYITEGLLPNLSVAAKELNARTNSYLDGAGKICTGIVVFDFVTQELCDKVIKTNF